MPSAAPRTVVITGAAGALGQAVAAELGSGNNLVLINRHLAEAPHGVLSLAADVTSDTAMAHAASLIARRFGSVEMLVHTAGGFEMGEPVNELSRATWDRLMEVNAWSFVTVSSTVGATLLTRMPSPRSSAACDSTSRCSAAFDAA